MGGGFEEPKEGTHGGILCLFHPSSSSCQFHFFLQEVYSLAPPGLTAFIFNSV